MLPEQLSLQILAILRDPTQSDKAQIIAQILSENPELTLLYFYCEEMSDTEIIPLTDALMGNKTITKIYFNRNQITDEGAKALAQVLRVNNTLQELHLNDNQIDASGTRELAKALMVNKSIQKLNLCNNKIGDKGAIALAEALKINKTITDLNLNTNLIGDEGAIYLAEALAHSAITTLDLNENNIGDAGAIALAEDLRANNTIQKITLRNNQIGDIGATALADACKTNPSIAELNLQYNSGVSPQCAGKILDTLLLPHTKITTQMLMLHPESYSKIRLEVVDGAANVSAKIALQNIYHVLENNIRLNLSTIFHNSQSHKDIFHHDQRNRKITDQTKAYIDSRLAPDADHVKLSDIAHVLVCQKHPELQKYLANKKKVEKDLAPEPGVLKIKDTILSNRELGKFLFKQGFDLPVLNDDVYSIVCEFLDFGDIAKLCIAKLLPDQGKEDSSTQVYCRAAQEWITYETLDTYMIKLDAM